MYECVTLVQEFALWYEGSQALTHALKMVSPAPGGPSWTLVPTIRANSVLKMVSPPRVGPSGLLWNINREERGRAQQPSILFNHPITPKCDGTGLKEMVGCCVSILNGIEQASRRE